MALGGINGAWTPNAPSDSSNVGLGASDIRSLKTHIQEPLDSEHIWSSSGGAGTGAHRAGSGRAFYGTASAVSSSDTDGRLMVTSDTSRLYAVGNSQVSYLLGGRFAVHSPPLFVYQGSNQTSQVTQHWVMESGVALLNTSSSTAVTLQRTYIGGAVGHANFFSGSSTTNVPYYYCFVNGATLNINRISDGTLQAAPNAEYAQWTVHGRVAL